MSALVVEAVVPAHVEARFHEADGKRYPLDHTVRALCFVDDDRVLCGSDDHTCSLWSLTGPRRLQVFQAKTHDVKCVAVSSDGARVAAGHGSWGGVKLWDLHTGALVHELDDSIMYVGAVGFVAGTRGQPPLLLCAVKGAHVWSWNAATGDVVKEPDDADGRSTPVAVSADGTALRATKATATLHRLPGLKKTAELSALPHDVQLVALSTDGSRAAAADDDGAVRSWSTSDASVVVDVDGGGGFEASACALAVQGDRVAFTDNDRTLHVVTARGRRSLPVGRAGSLAFSGDGERLAVGGVDGNVRIVRL